MRTRHRQMPSDSSPPIARSLAELQGISGADGHHRGGWLFEGSFPVAHYYRKKSSKILVSNQAIVPFPLKSTMVSAGEPSSHDCRDGVDFIPSRGEAVVSAISFRRYCRGWCGQIGWQGTGRHRQRSPGGRAAHGNGRSHLQSGDRVLLTVE